MAVRHVTFYAFLLLLTASNFTLCMHSKRANRWREVRTRLLSVHGADDADEVGPVLDQNWQKEQNELDIAIKAIEAPGKTYAQRSAAATAASEKVDLFVSWARRNGQQLSNDKRHIWNNDISKVRKNAQRRIDALLARFNTPLLCGGVADAPWTKVAHRRKASRCSLPGPDKPELPDFDQLSEGGTLIDDGSDVQPEAGASGVAPVPPPAAVEPGLAQPPVVNEPVVVLPVPPQPGNNGHVKGWWRTHWRGTTISAFVIIVLAAIVAKYRNKSHDNH